MHMHVHTYTHRRRSTTTYLVHAYMHAWYVCNIMYRPSSWQNKITPFYFTGRPYVSSSSGRQDKVTRASQLARWMDMIKLE
jgi:hypothetical protein